MPSTTTSGHIPARGRGKAKRHVELISLRINAGLTRDDLAAKTGLGRETIRLVEAGFVPSVRTQFAIAQAFGKRPLDLWPIERQPVIR